MVYVDCSSSLPKWSTYCYICRERGRGEGREGRGEERGGKRREGEVKGKE